MPALATPGIIEGTPDRLPAGYLADAGIAIGIVESEYVSGNVWAVLAAEVEQRAVMTRDRNAGHDCDDWGALPGVIGS